MNIDSLLDLRSNLFALGPDGQKVPGRVSDFTLEDEFVFEPDSDMDVALGSILKVSDGQDSVLAKIIERTEQGGIRLCIECYTSPGHERREDFRIYDKIYYKANLLCHASEKIEKLPAAIERIRANKLIIDSFLKGRYGYPGTDAEPYSRETPFNQSIWEINRKLDLLIHMVLAEEFRELMRTTPSDVNISASGVRFISETGYEMGDILEIHFILPMVPLLFIGLVGEVIRQKEVSCSKSGRFAVAARFIRVDAETKDDIIRYLFRRQREVLRKRQD
jgi:hypothetical protein